MILPKVGNEHIKLDDHTEIVDFKETHSHQSESQIDHQLDETAKMQSPERTGTRVSANAELSPDYF